MPAHAIIPFEVVSFFEPPRVRVQISGELDIATVPLLVEALRAVERERDCAIELDLGALTFTDASGLHAILSASRRAHRRERGFVVARPSARILRLFELSGIREQLELTDLPGRVQAGATQPAADGGVHARERRAARARRGVAGRRRG
jgi:anti-sigma B factor antagonist